MSAFSAVINSVDEAFQLCLPKLVCRVFGSYMLLVEAAEMVLKL